MLWIIYGFVRQEPLSQIAEKTGSVREKAIVVWAHKFRVIIGEYLEGDFLLWTKI